MRALTTARRGGGGGGGGGGECGGTSTTITHLAARVAGGGALRLFIHVQLNERGFRCYTSTHWTSRLVLQPLLDVFSTKDVATSCCSCWRCRLKADATLERHDESVVLCALCCIPLAYVCASVLCGTTVLFCTRYTVPGTGSKSAIDTVYLVQ